MKLFQRDTQSDAIRRCGLTIEQVMKKAYIRQMKKYYKLRSQFEWLQDRHNTAAAIVVQHKLTIAHIGDSRFYLIRPDDWKLTKDHSFVGELVEKGILDQEEAKTIR